MHFEEWGFIALSDFPFFFLFQVLAWKPLISVFSKYVCVFYNTGGLRWELFPRVARGARHGWCQGRKRRRGQDWHHSIGQLWQGETWRDWNLLVETFSASLRDSPYPELYNCVFVALWWIQNGSPSLCILFKFAWLDVRSYQSDMI